MEQLVIRDVTLERSADGRDTRLVIKGGLVTDPPGGGPLLTLSARLGPDGYFAEVRSAVSGGRFPPALRERMTSLLEKILHAYRATWLPLIEAESVASAAIDGMPATIHFVSARRGSLFVRVRLADRARAPHVAHAVFRATPTGGLAGPEWVGGYAHTRLFRTYAEALRSAAGPAIMLTATSGRNLPAPGDAIAL